LAAPESEATCSPGRCAAPRDRAGGTTMAALSQPVVLPALLQAPAVTALEEMSVLASAMEEAAPISAWVRLLELALE